MALTKEEIEVLNKQGLAADIRNQLSNAKGIESIITAWENETDPNTKEKLLGIVKIMAGRISTNVVHICDTLDLFAKEQNKIPFTHP